MQLDFAVIGVVVDLWDRRRGRPVIAIARWRDCRLVREHGCGIIVAPVTALRLLQRCASWAQTRKP